MLKKQTYRFAISLLAATSLAACAISPQPMDAGVHIARADKDYQFLQELQPRIERPITLYEAAARALKYNFDDKLALMETALQERQLSLANTDLLPELAATAGYRVRGNELAQNSISVETRRESLEPSTSQDKNLFDTSLSFTWNVLDFGVGFYQAKQQASRVMIAQQRRQRVANNVIREVHEAFLNAVIAQDLLTRLQPILKETEAALDRSKESQNRLLATPLDSLRDQKSLVEMTRQLRALRSEFLQAKSKLGALMSLPPGTQFTLAPLQPTDMSLRAIPFDMNALERYALSNRSELREEDYQASISQQEVRKAMLRMLPGLSFNAGYNYDSNSFLVFNDWANAGSRVTWNLMQLIQGPKAINAARAQTEVARARRLALSMAVLTQVHLAALEYKRSLMDLEQAETLKSIEGDILKLIANGENNDAQSGLERIRAEIAALAADLSARRSQVYGHVALGELRASLGLNMLPQVTSDSGLESLTDALRNSMRSAQIASIAQLSLPEPAAGVPFDDRVTFGNAIAGVFKRSD